MTINQDRLTQSKQPPTPPKRPGFNADRYSTQAQTVSTESSSAIAKSSTQMATQATQSLQNLDSQLSQFEDNYANAAARRIAEVPLRINAKIAQRLEQQTTTDPLNALAVAVEAWEIPDFDLPTLAPYSVAGCLPM